MDKLDVILCEVDSPMMSPTSQRRSSKPQVIMVATVSLTMANTSTFIPCSVSCAVTNRTVSVSNLSAQSNDSLIAITFQSLHRTSQPIKDSIQCILYPCPVNSLSESLDHVFTQKASDTEVLTPVYQ